MKGDNMKTKHTPGPWVCWGKNHKKNEADSNSRLISAAPELLEACEELLHRETALFKFNIRSCNCNQFLDSGDCRHIRAFKAIKKVKVTRMKPEQLKFIDGLVRVYTAEVTFKIWENPKGKLQSEVMHLSDCRINGKVDIFPQDIYLKFFNLKPDAVKNKE